MPNYKYVCINCGIEKEEYLPIIQRNRIQVCSQCGAIMQKLVGVGSSFNLKGDNFYRKGWQ